MTQERTISIMAAIMRSNRYFGTQEAVEEAAKLCLIAKEHLLLQERLAAGLDAEPEEER